MSSGTQNAKGQSYALMNFYSKCYATKYGNEPLVNRYRERWGFQDMIESVGEKPAMAIIEYYFEIQSSHTTRYLFNNFDALYKGLEARTLDREKRKRIMQQTRERMERLENESRG